VEFLSWFPQLGMDARVQDLAMERNEGGAGLIDKAAVKEPMRSIGFRTLLEWQ